MAKGGFQISILELLWLTAFVGLACAAFTNPTLAVGGYAKGIAFCLAAACIACACNPHSRHRWPALAALGGAGMFNWLFADWPGMESVAGWLWSKRFLTPPLNDGYYLNLQQFASLIRLVGSVFAGVLVAYLTRVAIDLKLD
jgi:hypothetical protein